MDRDKRHTAQAEELVHFGLTVDAVGMLHVSAASAFLSMQRWRRTPCVWYYCTYHTLT